MMQYKHLTTSICILALAGVAQAAELGDVAPRSYIGQPLAVDIDLVALTPEEVASLPVRLAQSDVYRGANVSMNPALASVSMQVERRGARQILHVTTTRAVDADYVHLYVELGVPGKSEVRLATVWLQHDPNPPPPPQPVAVAVAVAPSAPVAPPLPPPSAMTPAQAEQITAQARAARAAAAKPAVVAEPAPPARDRTKPAPLPSVHEAETGKPGEVKAAGTQARRIAGILVAADGKPIKPSDKEEPSEMPMSVSQALLPLAPLPLPKGVKRPAPASCPAGGMSAKECLALDGHNTEIASKLTELEGKLKALQGAFGGAAPAAVPAASAAAPAVKTSAPAAPAASAAASTSSASAASAGVASKAANAAAGGATNAAASAGHSAAQPAKTPASASTTSAGGASAGSASATAAASGATAKASANATASGGASSAKAGGKEASSARASASMAEQGETEAHAAKAAAAGASAASAASGEAAANAAASAASASSVPTKQVRVLPKLKYKKEKEKPAEPASSNTIPLIVGGVALLALLGGGLVLWRKKSAGKGPLKIWQGFRKKKEAEAAPEAEPTPESVA
jgi:pilus assembly protein FimV